jgi:hypothetical protein
LPQRRPQELASSESLDTNVLGNKTYALLGLAQDARDTDSLFKLWSITAPAYRYFLCAWFG